MGRRPKADPRQLDGVLVVDKPSGPTSADVLNRIKRHCGQPTIGHAGTLDPLAAGVLVVLLGKATRLAQHLSGADKAYRGELRLGVSTDTYDIQGAVTAEKDWSGVTPQAAAQAVLDWDAVTVQEVPAYSAAKHQGKPLYALARAGLETPVKEKAVRISGAQALWVRLPEVAFRATCSAGTYVRSLVHSLGTRLGCGATMTALTREASGPFRLEQAVPLDALLHTCAEDPAGLRDRLVPIPLALPEWRGVTLSAEQAARVMQGVRLPAPGARPGDNALLLDSAGSPLALAEAVAPDREGREPAWAILRGLW